MIGKVVDKRRDGKSSFFSLTRYIAGIGHKDKCTYLGTRNLTFVDFPGKERPDDFINLAVSEMESTALQNKRVGNPTFHCVISWPRGEKPSSEQVEESITMIQKNLGLEECQCVYGLHEDTEHQHLHIAVNRIHPESYRAINPAQGWTKKELEKTVREIEVAQGWAHELTGKHYTVLNDQVVATKEVDRVQSLIQKARDYEVQTGERSAQSHILDVVTPGFIDSVVSWSDFQYRLENNNIEYRKKGSGAVFIYEGQEVKASNISKKCTLSKLEKRFGKINEVKTAKNQKQKAEQKLQSKKESYLAAKNAFYQNKKKAISELRGRHDAERKQLIEEQREARKEALSGSWKGRGAEKNFLRSVLAVEHARQREELFEEQKQEREELNASIGQFSRAKKWREGIHPPGNYVYTDSINTTVLFKKIGILDMEAIKVAGGAGYRVPGKNKPLVVDTGRVIRTTIVNENAVLATLQLARAKWGGCSVHGNKAYIDLCVKLAVENGIKIANPELQTRVQKEKQKLGGKSYERVGEESNYGILRNRGEPIKYGRANRAGRDTGDRRRSSISPEGEIIMKAVLDNRKKIVANLIDALEKDTPPWRQNWDISGRACNAVSEKPYRGVNNLNLEVIRITKKLDDPRFCTFKQASEAGWKIKKGERHIAKVEFWQWSKREEKLDEKGITKKIEVKLERPIVHVYPVFHASQIEGIPEHQSQKVHVWDSSEKAERVIKESGAKIEYGGDDAFYKPQLDYIQLPGKENFHNAHAYYSTALHELGHWTGHESRLNRPLTSFINDKEGYAKEELRAEIASMFVCAETGIQQSEEHFQNHTAYVEHYIDILKKDPNELFRASADAEKIAEYILQHERKREQNLEKIQERTEIQRSEPINSGQLEEVKALNLVPGSPKIYDAKKSGSYMGRIIHSDKEKGYSVQQVGKASLLVHKHDNLARIPEVAELLKIQYKPNEKATVNRVNREKKQELTR